MSSTASKIVASVILWSVVVGILVLGDFRFTSAECPCKAALGGGLLLAAVAIPPVIWRRRHAESGGRDAGPPDRV